MAALSKVYPRGAVNAGSKLTVLPKDGTATGLVEWRSIHTPGHASGHGSFFCERSGVPLARSAFAATKQESCLAAATQPAGWHGPPAYFPTDWKAARESVKRLAALRLSTLAAGRGRPLSGADVADSLVKLAIDFDVIDRPQPGRYVNRPEA